MFKPTPILPNFAFFVKFICELGPIITGYDFPKAIRLGLSVYRSVSPLSIRHVSFSHYSLKTYWGISTKLVHLWRHKTFLHTKRNKKNVAKRPPKSQRNHCKNVPPNRKEIIAKRPPVTKRPLKS